MLNIDGKVFMNIQEAVAWLLKNNALPFQSTANYVADTEIAKSTIINPSPAEIKVGALVLFADSKIGTVSGITSNGFMVGSDYTDIADALAYISQVEIDASGHLITTLSDGQVKDAGLVKQISSFAFNASRHLIATYNNGTTADLGLIKGVSSFSIDSSMHFIVTYDNGTTADLGSLGDFSNVAFTAKTLYQTDANFEANWNFLSTDFSELTITSIYSKIAVINKTLQIVLCFKITNSSSAAVNLNAHNEIARFSFNQGVFTSRYGSKVIDLEGVALNAAQSPSSHNCAIRFDAGSIGTLDSNQIRARSSIVLNRYADALYLKFGWADSYSLGAGSSVYGTAEMSLLLL